MKRILAIVTLTIMMIIVATPAVFAATFTVEKTSPEDGQTGMAKDNMGIKIYFTEEVYSKDYYKANAKLCKLYEVKEVEENGMKSIKRVKEMPTKVVFNAKEKNVMMILAVADPKNPVKDKTKYEATVGQGFKSAKGNTLAEPMDITFETLSSKSSMTVSFVMMGAMVIGMIFFTSRSVKKEGKQQEKEQSVNPYKEAKRTGKSVAEIVAKEEKRKMKENEKKARHKEENKVEISEGAFEVGVRRPISAAGSTYVHPMPKKKVKEIPKPKNNNTSNKKKKNGKKK